MNLQPNEDVLGAVVVGLTLPRIAPRNAISPMGRSTVQRAIDDVSRGVASYLSQNLIERR